MNFSGKELIGILLEQIENFEKNWNKTPNRLIISQEQFELVKDELVNPYTVKKIPQNLGQKLVSMEITFKDVFLPVVYYENIPKGKMGLTTKQFFEYLKHYKDEDLPIYIERIEDVYFEKHGWNTEHFDFGSELESTEGILATGVGQKDKKIIIFAHK